MGTSSAWIPVALLVCLPSTAEPPALISPTPAEAESSQLHLHSTEPHRPREVLGLFSASAFGHIIPDGQSYGQPTVAADHHWLHLEARYNYEALQTGSAWLGYNAEGGNRFTWSITPMVGGVFGDLDGIAPGYELSLEWWRLEFYSEGEYVFDLNDSASSFYYAWSEISLVPAPWFRIGMVIQRTRVYSSDREVQRGVLLGFRYRRAEFTTYVFNPDDSKPIVALAVGLEF